MEGFIMKKFLWSESGIVEKENWQKDCWINIEIPSNEEINYLIEELGVPESFISDIKDVDERPRIEEEDGWNLIILRVPYRNKGNDIPFITVPIGFIMKEHYFITVCYYKTDMLSDFVRYADRKQLNIQGSWDLLFRLFLSSSVWYLKYLKRLNNQSRQVEQELERSIQNEELQKLLKIEKSLVYFMTSMRANANLLVKLKNIRSQRQYFDEDLVEDVDIELHQALDQARIYSDILSGTMDAYASVISNNLNVIMKRMTSISLILMIPTLIASLYGMNVPNGLEERGWGFLVVCISSAFFALMMFWVLKKKKWL
ncbi:magnesium transporter CorA family protein [Odoribacter sp. OttesenSCG-928-G04]|nr:magnesium transporter CorA family protein [Odoribacter sp. OttesenSCG-928-G04]